MLPKLAFFPRDDDPDRAATFFRVADQLLDDGFPVVCMIRTTKESRENFVIVEDHEVKGEWAGRFLGVDVRPVGINVDRLAKGFLNHLDPLERSQLTKVT